MKIGIVKESRPRERRVAVTPTIGKALVERGFEVTLEADAGVAAGFSDGAYEAVGVKVGAPSEVLDADVIAAFEPTEAQIAAMREGVSVFCFVHALRRPELVQAFAKRKATVYAMERVPRTTLAQKCDALSSMANLAGQRAILEAASVLQRPLGAVFSAAGKINPAHVLVIGAGVAGLAAIGTARALGAQVRAFDTRSAARDDVKSLGAEFIEVDLKESGEGSGGYAKTMSPEFIAAEMALFLGQAPEVDIVVTTALVPGTTAPTLWTAEHVAAMKPGSVVVDLAAHQGGNCPLSRPDEAVLHPVSGGTVTVLGPTDLPSRMARTASELYAKNIANLLDELAPTSNLARGPARPFPEGHEILAPMALLADGATPPPPPEPAKTAAPAQTPQAPAAPAQARPAPKPQPSKAPASASKHVSAHPALGKLSHPPPRRARSLIFAAIGMLLVGGWLFLRYATTSNVAMQADLKEFVDQLAIFTLACFVGWQVIWNVTPALHTPLMSVTNAISGIILVGGLLEGSSGHLEPRSLLGMAAVLLATINIAGGFWVTHRMLKMFRK